MADLGARIVEFLDKRRDMDFLWRTPRGLAALDRPSRAGGSQGFLDSYAGGWFEGFPSIGEACEYRNAEMPVYGEVADLPWEVDILRDDGEELSLLFRTRTIKTPFLVEKKLTLRSGIPSLFIEEGVRNLGKERVDFLWAQHPNLGAPFLSGSCRIDLPACDISHPIDLPASRLEPGAIGRWPLLAGRDGKAIDLSRMPGADAGSIDLPFAANMAGHWTAVRDPGRGLGFGLAWDPAAWDQALLWMNAGGETGYPRYGDAYALCIMPMNSAIHPLSRAVELGTAASLGPGEEKSAWITASIFEAGREVEEVRRDGGVRTIGESV